MVQDELMSGPKTIEELREGEVRLLSLIFAKMAEAGHSGLAVNSIKRRSDRDYDILVDAKSHLYFFTAHLPLLAIRETITWSSDEIADMTDYPEMVRQGDWSGIRDSSEDKIWAIFERSVLPNMKLP